jgi:hypothetical protein
MCRSTPDTSSGMPKGQNSASLSNAVRMAPGGWPIIVWWMIYLPLCWWYGVKPRAPRKPWVPLRQHEPRGLNVRRWPETFYPRPRRDASACARCFASDLKP